MKLPGLRWLAIALAGSVAACAGSDKKADDLNVEPKNYKAEIMLLLTNTLEDPTNIRDAFIADPVRANNGTRPYYVCVRFNTRDGAKKYNGSEDRVAYFFSGELNQLVPAQPEQCAKAPYKPFPELQKLCLGKRCD